MSLSIREKYLNALKTFDDWIIVSDWAKRVGELLPDLLAKAELEAENQANETTGLREIATSFIFIITKQLSKQVQIG